MYFINFFSFFIEGVQKGVRLVGGEFKPKVLISDASPAIINAFYNSFESAESNVVCWAHVKRNLYQKVSNEAILADVDILQLSPSIDVFEKGVKLFMSKWKQTHTSFCKYFEKVWLQKNFSWFEGYQLCIPSHNNALEAYNNVIKTHYTFRRRLNIDNFNTQLFKCLSDMSCSYDENRMYAVTASISIEDWSQAIQWVKDKKNNYILDEKIGQVQTVYVPSTKFVNEKKRKLNDEDLIGYKQFDGNSFDDFFENIFSIWEISLDLDNWKNSVCTCPRFMKMFHCKHILGISIILAKVKPPAAANPQKLAEKKKRGRPAIAKKALIVQ